MAGEVGRFASTIASVLALTAAAGCASREPLAPSPAAAATADGGARTDASGEPAPDAAAPPTWAEMSPLGALPSGATMTDIWSADGDDLFLTASVECAAGAAACDGWLPVVLRWRRDAGWTAEQGLPTTGWTPQAIDGTTVEDVWAVGGTAIYHRDAGGWSPVDPAWQAVAAGASSQPVWLESVRAFPGGEVWAVSEKVVLHRAGGVWTATSVPPAPDQTTPGSVEQYLRRLWAFAPDEVWVAGNSAIGGSTMMPSFLCRAESAPLDCIAPTSGSQFGVAGLFGAGDGRVWATVPYASDSADAPIVLERIDWPNGKAVTRASIDGWPAGMTLALFGMWGRSANDVWAVGSGAPADGAAIAHFDGNRWAMVAPPPTGGERCNWVTGGGQSLFVATSTGRIFRLDQAAAR